MRTTHFSDSGRGDLPTETPLDREPPGAPLNRDLSFFRDPLDIAPPNRDPPGQRPQTETPRQRPLWTETPGRNMGPGTEAP